MLLQSENGSILKIKLRQGRRKCVVIGPVGCGTGSPSSDLLRVTARCIQVPGRFNLVSRCLSCPASAVRNSRQALLIFLVFLPPRLTLARGLPWSAEIDYVSIIEYY